MNANAADEIDTLNKFLVGTNGNDLVVFLRPLPQRLTHQDALLLAAYLVTMVGDDEQFKKTVQAVLNA